MRCGSSAWVSGRLAASLNMPRPSGLTLYRLRCLSCICLPSRYAPTAAHNAHFGGFWVFLGSSSVWRSNCPPCRLWLPSHAVKGCRCLHHASFGNFLHIVRRSRSLGSFPGSSQPVLYRWKPPGSDRNGSGFTFSPLLWLPFSACRQTLAPAVQALPHVLCGISQ